MATIVVTISSSGRVKPCSVVSVMRNAIGHTAKGMNWATASAIEAHGWPTFGGLAHAGGFEHTPQTIFRSARRHESRAVDEDDGVLPVEERLQFADALRVDDGRPVNADEAIRIQCRLHPLHRLAQQVGVGADVEADVVALGFDPIDLFDLEKVDPPRRFDHQPLRVTLLAI